MSIKPIDMMMTITQSQTLKPLDSDYNIKHAQHAEIILEQNLKNKESVIRIPDDENHTEVMDTIKHGMDNSSFHHHQEEKNGKDEKDIPEKSLLDDDNGNTIDILG